MFSSTDLSHVGRGRNSEGVAVEREHDLGHALDVLAVHCGLCGKTPKSNSFETQCNRQYLRNDFHSSQQGGEKGQSHVTHISILVCGGSHPGVHVADVAGGPNDQGGPGVDDGLAPTRARHHVTVDGHAADDATELRSDMVMQFNHNPFI